MTVVATDVPVPGWVTMCAVTTWICDVDVPVRHGDVTGVGLDLASYLTIRIPEIEQKASAFSADHPAVLQARADVRAARAAMTEPVQPDLAGELRRVRRLARCFLALWDTRNRLTSTDSPMPLGATPVTTTPFPADGPPKPVPGCEPCAEAVAARTEAVKAGDLSAAVDCNVRIRTHDTGHNGTPASEVAP